MGLDPGSSRHSQPCSATHPSCPGWTSPRDRALQALVGTGPFVEPSMVQWGTDKPCSWASSEPPTPCRPALVRCSLTPSWVGLQPGYLVLRPRGPGRAAITPQVWIQPLLCSDPVSEDGYGLCPERPPGEGALGQVLAGV